MTLTPVQTPARLVHVAPDITPASGSSHTAIPRLCGLLARSGFDVELLTTHSHDAPPHREERDGCRIVSGPRNRLTAGLGASDWLLAEAGRLLGDAGLLHVHGMWRLCAVDALQWAHGRKLSTVLSPMGNLAPSALRQSRFRKMAFWHLWQARALRGVTCYHATSELEHDHLRALGIRQPIAVIPLGVDIPDLLPRKPAGSASRTVLFLGRVSPIKNLPALIRAWREVQGEVGEARLRIVGPDDRGHVGALRRLADELGAQRVTFEHGAWDRDRDRAYQEADIVVLPSLCESYGLVVAEALAQARPVIASTGAPWQALQREGCGWWVEPTPAAIAQALREALGEADERLVAMGSRGRKLAERDLGWESCMARFDALYRWILGGGAVPDFVST